VSAAKAGDILPSLAGWCLDAWIVQIRKVSADR
jgi:hypothetical protein